MPDGVHAPSMAELRFRLLSKWGTLHEALEALDLDSSMVFGSEEVDRLCDAALAPVQPEVVRSQYHQSSPRSPRRVQREEMLGQPPTTAASRMLLVDLMTTMITLNDGQLHALDSEAVPRSAVILAFGRHGPREGFRDWASRILLQGPGVFTNLAKLLGPRSRARKGVGPLRRRELCEAVALLNGHVDDAAEWFDRIRGVVRAVGDSRTITTNASQASLTSAVEEVLREDLTKSGEKEVTLDFNVLTRTVIAHPRLQGAEDCEGELTIEEVVVRLIFIWGDLTLAFGLEPQKHHATAAEMSTNRAARSPKAMLKQMAAVETSVRKRSIWPPGYDQWLSALRGTPQRRFLSEAEARTEAARFAMCRQIHERFFPNMCDRLLITKDLYHSHELICVRYSLQEYGYWGQGGPLPVDVCPSASRPMQWGKKPFIGAFRLKDSPEGEGGADDSMQDLAPSLNASVEVRSPIDLRCHSEKLKQGICYLRAPAFIPEDAAGAEGTTWCLQLFMSDDGLTPKGVVSTPLRFHVAAVAPPSPSHIMLLSRTHDTLTLAWLPPFENGGMPVSHYELCVWEWEEGLDAASAMSRKPIWDAESALCQQRVTDLMPHMTYVARVRCSSSAGKSAWSAKSTQLVTGPEVPGASGQPSIVGVGRHEALVRWTPPHLHYKGTTRHAVQAVLCDRESGTTGSRASLLDLSRHGQDKEPTKGEHTCQMRVAELLPNTKYRFKVRSCNESGAGPWSELSSLVVTSGGVSYPPHAPEAAEIKQSSIRLKWDHPLNDGGSPITEYIIAAEPLSGGAKRMEHSCTGQPMVSGSMSGCLKGLEGDTQYMFCVFAVNAHGLSQASPCSAPIKTGALLPQPPQEVRTYETGPDCITIRWQPPASDGGEPIFQYRVEAKPQKSDAEGCEVYVGGTEAKVHGLAGNMHYLITVQSENQVGVSRPSLELHVYTPPNHPGQCGAPRPSGDLMQTAVNLTWDPPQDDGGRPVSGYEVTVAPARDDGDSAQRQVISTECAALVSGLSPHCSYRAWVRARNTEGWGGFSKASAIMHTAAAPPGPPPPPQPVDVTSRSIGLMWDPPDSDPPATEYEIWYNAEDAAAQQAKLHGGKKQKTYGTGGLSTRVIGLEPLTRYVFHLRARNSAGWSPWSDESIVWETSDKWSSDEIKEAYGKRYGSTAKSVFKALDRDSDGQLTRHEFVRAFDEAGGGLESVPMEQRLELFLSAADEAQTSEGHYCASLSYREFARFFSTVKAHDETETARRASVAVTEVARRGSLELAGDHLLALQSLQTDAASPAGVGPRRSPWSTPRTSSPRSSLARTSPRSPRVGGPEIVRAGSMRSLQSSSSSRRELREAGDAALRKSQSSRVLMKTQLGQQQISSLILSPRDSALDGSTVGIPEGDETEGLSGIQFLEQDPYHGERRGPVFEGED